MHSYIISKYTTKINLFFINFLINSSFLEGTGFCANILNLEKSMSGQVANLSPILDMLTNKDYISLGSRLQSFFHTLQFTFLINIHKHWTKSYSLPLDSHHSIQIIHLP